MNEYIEDIKDTFHLTFTIGIFFIVALQIYFEATQTTVDYQTLLKWCGLIILYILGYLVFILTNDYVDKNKIFYLIIKTILITNLVFIGGTLFILVYAKLMIILFGIGLTTIAYEAFLWFVGIILPMLLVLVPFLFFYVMKMNYFENK